MKITLAPLPSACMPPLPPPPAAAAVPAAVQQAGCESSTGCNFHSRPVCGGLLPAVENSEFAQV